MWRKVAFKDHKTVLSIKELLGPLVSFSEEKGVYLILKTINNSVPVCEKNHFGVLDKKLPIKFLRGNTKVILFTGRYRSTYIR